MQVISGLKQIYNGASEVLEGVNPLITNMTEKNQDIATLLLDSGYTPDDIQGFIDVSSIQFQDWVQLEMQVRDRMAKIAQRRPKPTPKK